MINDLLTTKSHESSKCVKLFQNPNSFNWIVLYFILHKFKRIDDFMEVVSLFCNSNNFQHICFLVKVKYF